MSKEIKKQRRRAYAHFFEPAYIRMEKIHTDYLRSFHAFYNIALNREIPQLSLFQSLRGYSIEYASWRQDIRSFNSIAKKLIQNFSESEEKKAISSFSRAIKNYFKVAGLSEKQHTSWFSYFLWNFENNIIKGFNPFEYDYKKFIAGADPSEDFLIILERTYTKDIPARWNSIVRAKTRLQEVFNI